MSISLECRTALQFLLCGKYKNVDKPDSQHITFGKKVPWNLIARQRYLSSYFWIAMTHCVHCMNELTARLEMSFAHGYILLVCVIHLAMWEYGQNILFNIARIQM